MSRPVIATKLYVPRVRPGLVARERLHERLGRGMGSRLTLMSAPAGFGKTTLLAEWLDQAAAEGRSVAWLALDREDSEPAWFWTCVVTALRTAAPGIGATALDLAASTPLPTEHLLTTLLNDLAAAPGEIWLVLDDYHLVDGPEVSDGTAFLLEHLPRHVHVVISTRADPHLPLARWRARGELTEVRAADLRFTPEEATAYLTEAAGLPLASAEVAALEQRTEGWIAALQLAAISIRAHDDATAFIARFAGDDRYVVDYLVEEVLQHQPEPVRAFLLQTSVLDRLTGPLCDAVTGRDDGAAMLQALERANLLVVPLDDRREWWRYHHLFADVLRARLLAEEPDLVPLLHLRASAWCERQGLVDESVGHALAARDVEHAAHLMELAVPAIRRDRREATMIGWLAALPDETVRASPVLGVFDAYLLMASGDLDAAEARLDAAERALTADPDGARSGWARTDELRTLPATIAVYRASLAQARGDVAGTTRHGLHALELAGPTDHLARGGAAGFVGLGAWARGDVTIALETFAQAVASLHAAGNLVDELSSTVVLADLWLCAGRPETARRLYERALRVAEMHGDRVARATADLHVGVSELDLELGDLEGATLHLDASAALAERAAMTESRYRWFVAAGRVADAEGDPEEAIALLDRAGQLFRPGFFPDVRPVAALTARVRIGRGHLSEAADWARQAGVSVTDEVGYLSEFDHLTLARLLIADHRAHPEADAADHAVALLDRLLPAAEASGREGSALEIRMLQALARDAQGQRPLALESLESALTQAPEPGGYALLLLAEGAPMTALLDDVAQLPGVAGEHARRLLASGPSGDAGPAGAPGAPGSAGRKSPSPAVPLSDRELQVLRLLDSELTGPQIARALFVSHNTLRTHTKHIFTKLDVTSRRAAVRRAHELGLV